MESYLKDYSHIKKENVQRIHDSKSTYFEGGGGPTFSEFSMFAAFPDSPTAKSYKKAFDLYCAAQGVLLQYTKTTVETNEDCEYLQQAFHDYAKSNLCESHLFGTFKPQIMSDLIDQYLKIRPNDILTEYLKTVIIFAQHPDVCKSKIDYSSVKHLKKLIKMNEEFAFKVSKFKPQNDFRRDLLINLYFLLGSLYSNTDQEVRALDSFQKSYDLDNNNYDSLYGVAFYHFYRNSDKAESLLQKFLQLAPECNKRYNDAFYTLALIYLKRGNYERFKDYYYKGLEAEKKQLSCLPAWDTYSRKKARLHIKLLEGFSDRYLEGLK